MKLKKMLAAVTAAALAVSTMAVSSFSVSAAADVTLNTGTLGAAKLEENQWWTGHALNPQITLGGDWGVEADLAGYSAVEVEYTCGNTDDINQISVVAQSGDTMTASKRFTDDWFSTGAAPQASGKITLDLSTVQDKAYYALLVQVEPKDTFSIGDTFDPKLTVTSAKLVAATEGEGEGDGEGEGGSGTEAGDTFPSDWTVAACGFTTGWGGWKSAHGEDGESVLTCTVGDVMDANSIATAAELGGFGAQVWGGKIGDSYNYTVVVTSTDGTEVINDSGTYTVAEKDDGSGDPNLQFKQYSTTACYGTYTFADDDVITITITNVVISTDEGGGDVEEPTGPVVLFEGNKTDNIEIAGSKISKYKDTAVITVTYTPAETELAFMTGAGKPDDEMTYPNYTGAIAGGGESWYQPAESSYWVINSASELGVSATFTTTVADYLAAISATAVPEKVFVCPWNGTTVTKVVIEGDLKGSGSGDDNKPVDPAPENPSDNTDDTAASYPSSNYSVVVPFNLAPASSTQVADTISSAADGEKVSVSLTGNTAVAKSVLEAIAGKDITAEFKLTGGVTWVINGKDIENAKKVDLGVRLRSKNIPADKIAEAAGENKTVQFSLRHNGDFGFKGALFMPFSTKYNGQFANLYYYNKAKDTLDFVGSSKISGGKASFVFTHASDYVVVIDDHAYGEDVSSAAGVYETASETSEAPFAAIIAAAAILGAAAIVIRKRLAK